MNSPFSRYTIAIQLQLFHGSLTAHWQMQSSHHYSLVRQLPNLLACSCKFFCVQHHFTVLCLLQAALHPCLSLSPAIPLYPPQFLHSRTI